MGGRLCVVLGLAAALAVFQVAAQTTTAVCSTSAAWTSNSLQQSPCLVSSFLFAECASNVVPIPPQTNNTRYPVPGETGVPPNECTCSSVAYSMLAACSFCQGQVYAKWSFWRANCSDDLTRLGSWPLTVPRGTAIPIWAFNDVLSLDGWDVVHAQLVAGEGQPDVVAGPTGTSTITTTSRSSTTTAQEPTTTSSGGGNVPITVSPQADDGGSSTPVGPIVGGVVGGLVVLGLGAIAVALMIRRYRGHTRDTSDTRTVSTRVGGAGSMTSRWVNSGGKIFSPDPPMQQEPPTISPFQPYQPSFTPPVNAMVVQRASTGDYQHGVVGADGRHVPEV